MAAYIKDILDKNNDIIYPTTKVKAIFDDAGKTLDSLIAEKANANDVYTKKEIDNMMYINDEITPPITSDEKEEGLIAIVVTSNPSKINYKHGETLSLSGLEVVAVYNTGDTKDISSSISSNPINGSTLSTVGDNTITISYTENEVTKNTTFSITVKDVLSSIAITSNPSKTTYDKDETLSLTGLIVTATYASGTTKNVTSLINSSPANGATLSTTGNNTVTISYTEDSITKITSFSITVNETLSIVTWAGGTDAEIVAMVEAADRGEINLADYWAVGQERQVTLSSMEATGVGESHVAQTVTMVLMNAGGKTLANATASGRTECSFIVGLKNGLSNGTTDEYGYMNSSSTNSGGWDSCARRTWCNSVFRNAIPSSIRNIFKQHLNITADGSSTSTATSTDYFALPAEKEVFGSTTYANSIAESSLTQFLYYSTSSNRIKTKGDSGSADLWWERSPISDYSYYFCLVSSDGSAYCYSAYSTRLIAPFGCI